MDRLIGTVVLVLVVVLVLPTIAAAARATVPLLIAVVFALGLLRLARPPRRRK